MKQSVKTRYCAPGFLLSASLESSGADQFHSYKTLVPLSSPIHALCSAQSYLLSVLARLLSTVSDFDGKAWYCCILRLARLQMTGSAARQQS